MRVSSKECPNYPMVRKALAKEFNKRFRCTGVEDAGCDEEKKNPEKSQILYVMMTFIHDDAPFIPGWYKCVPVHPS
jgi:hypothetical protein